MTKEELKKHFDHLNSLHSKFVEHELDYHNGKNKKIREQAQKNCENQIRWLEMYVQGKNELYDMLTKPGTTDYQKAIIWQEFTSLTFFNKDLKAALAKIEKLIETMED